MAKGAYIGVSYTPLSPTFSANTWEQIVYACRNNVVPDTWAVGNQKSMKIGSADYLIDIIGKNHDSFADGSGKAPLTFLMHGTLAEPHAMNDGSDSNNGGWTNSSMRTTHLPAILKTMPPEVQAGIKEVNKLTSAGSASSTINTTADKLFLLAESEILGYASSSFSGEGSQYAYFANGNSPEKFSPDGTRRSWWLRSPYASNRTHFVSAWMKNSFGASVASTLNYVAVAFCFGGASGPSSAARKIKKGYIGIENVARKIKKAYIGIGGVARPCWSGGELTYYGTITPLSQGRYGADGAAVGNYALIGGGVVRFSNTWSDAMDAYDTSLTRSLPTAHDHREYYSAASVGDYAVFAGGKQSSNYYNTAFSYNKSLTKQSLTSLSSARYDMAATSFGKYALFAGGLAKSSQRYTYVDSYDTSLTRTLSANLSVARAKMAATTVGNYAIFAGGITSAYTSGITNVVNAYDSSFTRTIPTALSESKYECAATTIGNYALIGGGQVYDSSIGTFYTSKVDVYDASLTKTMAGDLSSNAAYNGATTVGEYALFAGGLLYDDYDYFDGLFYDTVDAYDASLTKSVQNKLSVPRGEPVAVTVGDFAIFAGGRLESNYGSDAVDVFTVA